MSLMPLPIIKSIKIFGACTLWLASGPDWSPVALLGVNASLIGACSGWAPGCHVACWVARLHAAVGSSFSALEWRSKSTLNHWGTSHTITLH